MKFLLLLVLLSGCGKKVVYTDPSVPNNLASPTVQAEIDEELVKLQNDFDELGVKVDLTRMPVVVAPLPFGVVGRCQYGMKNTGIFIILSPVLFPEAESQIPLDSHLFEKDFVRVLIHEIGHCYFRRMHEDPEFLEIPGNSFELRHEGSSVFFDKIPTSLMPAESVYRMPKALRNYYISEIVGKAELLNPTILGEFTEFQVLENDAGLEKGDSDTVEPAKE